MCSSLVRASKSKLAIQQPPIGGYCNPSEKDTLHPKTKEKPQATTILQEGHHHDKNQIPYPLDRQPVNWRTIIPKRFSHCCKASEPNVRLPTLGTWHRTGNPQGIWPWRAARFDYRTSEGLQETETPLLEGTNKILHAQRPKVKEQWPHRRLNQAYLQVWRVSCGGVGWQLLATGTRALSAAVPWLNSSWRSPLSLP